ncbi:hypothetical protein SCA6_000209 [Theobroma cacao]
MPSSAPCIALVSKSNVFPDQKSKLGELKLSVSDLPMLSCHYIQKGCLFTRSPVPIDSLVSLLKQSLSKTLSFFPPLAGRLYTDPNGYIYVTCNDGGVEFYHATCKGLSIRDVIGPLDVPEFVKKFFCFDKTPDFSRNSVLVSPAVLKVPEGGPKVTFNEKERLRERIFSFSREAILELKARVNNNEEELLVNGNFNAVEILGKQSNDKYHNEKSKSRLFRTAPVSNTAEISSFQSLCALLWRAVTRARKLPSFQKTTFRMAVNCRHRLNPKLDPLYFGNAIQSIPTYASAGDVTSRELRWCAEQLNQSVRSHDDETVRRFVKEWEKDPRTVDSV